MERNEFQKQNAEWTTSEFSISIRVMNEAWEKTKKELKKGKVYSSLSPSIQGSIALQ